MWKPTTRGFVLDHPRYGCRLAPLRVPVPRCAAHPKALAMAFGADGRKISRQNLLSHWDRFGRDPEQSGQALRRVGAAVTRSWRDAALALGAEAANAERWAPRWDLSPLCWRGPGTA